uniref:Lipocalin/cytosolic fatty-acid binding domain-containing protein n=1 Tax=Ursus americanus TaxID=9643 RepID=A0A452QBW6_URSAM
MRAVLLPALLALVSVPRTQAVWLGRLDPKQLLGSWYVLAVASGEKGFALEKATKNIEGVVVTLTPENNLKMLSSRHRLERCDVNVAVLLRQNSGWVFENPSLGVLDYRVLGTNFRDYAIVFTQLEFKDEAFSTVELYSRTELASQEAMRLFARWSKGLGFLSQQQATLQQDCECRPMPKGSWLTSAGLGVPPGLREPGRTGVEALHRVTRSLPKARPAGLAPSQARLWAERGGHSTSWVPRWPGEAPTLTALLAPPVTCARKVFQVSCLPQHRPGSYTPGLCCREGPGTGAGADTPQVNLGSPSALLGFQ